MATITGTDTIIFTDAELAALAKQLAPLVAPLITPPVVTPPVVTPPVTTPPTGVTWMYLNGVKTLAGDFTGNGTSVNYEHAVTGAQLNGGTKDIQLTVSGAGEQWPYFLPYFAANYML